MRNCVVFLQIPFVSPCDGYYHAAHRLNLLPIVITRTAYKNSVFTSSNMVIVRDMETPTVMAAIDEIGRSKIAGVFACHDATVEPAARISAALGRPHGDADAIARCNDKLRCRDFLAEQGYKSVDYRRASSPTEVAVAAEALAGHVVVKPRSSTGSLGVRICRTPQEAADWALLLNTAGIDDLILEAHLDGPQFSVSLFDGEPLAVHRDHIASGPSPLFIGVDAPANVSDVERSEICDFARKICRSIGCTKGPALVELRRGNDHCNLVEVNPRPGLSSSQTLSGATGIDHNALCLKFVCGLPYSIEDEIASSQPQAAALRYLVRDGQSIRRIVGTEDAKTTENVEKVVVFESRFERVGPASSSLDCVATVLANAETLAIAASSADEALRKIKIIPEGKIARKIRRFRRRLARRYDKWKTILSNIAAVRPQ
ncbi:MAG: ATP-grasp domain-containing protein [Hyphomicrobiaceae bacterium]